MLDRDDGSWKPSAPVALLNGRDLGGWHTLRPGREEGWYVEDGALKNHRRADVLVSDQAFWNFRLQVEFLVHPNMNGGIGLRGRYEIQILDDHGTPPSDHGNAALYGRIAPAVNASRPAREWQSLDVRLVGRALSVELNGVKTIDRKIIDGFTAMANGLARRHARPDHPAGRPRRGGVPKDRGHAANAVTRSRAATLAAVAALAIALYLLPIGGRGLIGPDEPRYASISREMAESGDWVTPQAVGRGMV